MKKIFAILFCIVFSVGIGIVWLKNSTSNIFVKQLNLKQSYTNSAEKHFREKIPFNILLLGYAGGKHEGTYLTDSMILVHVDIASKAAVLISIPRDLWVKLPSEENRESFWKINAAYEIGRSINEGVSGGGNMAKYAVEQVTGMKVDRFLSLDFDGFQKIINLLGGVDVKVDKTFDDFEYPVDGKETDLCGKTEADLPELVKIATLSATEAFPCRYEYLHFEAGIQKMDGATALKFARSRHSLQDGSDFGRAARQRNLIIAAKQKALSIGIIPKIPSLIDTLDKNLRTDITLDEIKTAVGYLADLTGYSIRSIAISPQNVLKENRSDDGQYILTSQDGIGNWSMVHNWIQDQLDLTTPVSSPVIKVENASQIPGLGLKATQKLRNKNFTVVEPTTAQIDKADTTSIVLYNQRVDKNVLESLKKEFKVTNINSQQSNGYPYDILITLGKDYAQE